MAGRGYANNSYLAQMSEKSLIFVGFRYGSPMSDFDNQSNTVPEKSGDVSAIKERIANLQDLPLDQHSNEYENIHQELVRTLAQIDGL